MNVLGGGGGACDPGAQAVDRPQPGEEAGGVRARAQPAQALAFLLVSSGSISWYHLSLSHTHKMDAWHVHAARSHPSIAVRHPLSRMDQDQLAWSGLRKGEREKGNRISRSWHSLSHTVCSSRPPIILQISETDAQ